MSWQVAIIGLVGLVLAGGAVWYERSRPPARLVALVAALAALAVAGRLVLAPVPNVLATTDIALLTGYSLGAAPGFAVGALAGLVSNIWLGQGPWTPWQMAGWGLVGLGGALLALLTLRRAGRATLAIAAALAGLGFGALLDLSVMVSYGGEQSLDRYLALSARGLPFNLAHAAGNAALAWVAAPAIVRMLERYRVRSTFTWHPQASRTSQRPRYSAHSGTLGVAGALVLLVAGLPMAASAEPSADATGWLRAQQNGDGGWGNEPGAKSSAAMTTWVMLGLESAGVNPRDLRSGGHDPVGYLRKRLGQVKSATDLERTILALEGAGVDSSTFASRDLTKELARARLRNGSWRGGVNPTAFGVLALSAAGSSDSGRRRSAGWLARAQNEDGGWGFDAGVASDPDSTGAALQALASLPGFGGPSRSGVGYLRRAQRADGGFPAQAGLTSNSQSTAWAIQGLVAAGANPQRVRKRNASPIDFLRRHQQGDGHVVYSRRSDQTPVWVTAQALMGLEGVALPIEAVARKPREPRRDESEAASPKVGGGSPAGQGTEGKGAGSGRGAPGRKVSSKNKRKARARQAPSKKRAAEGPRADRVVVKADPPPAAAGAVGGESVEGEDGGPPALAWAGIAAFALAAIGAGAWAYRRRTG